MASIIVSAEAAVETRLLHWQEGVTTVFHKHGRLRLLEDSLSLQYEPVEVKDSGEYVCKANGQIDTGGLVRLIVQGEKPKLQVMRAVSSCSLRAREDDVKSSELVDKCCNVNVHLQDLN